MRRTRSKSEFATFCLNQRCQEKAALTASPKRVCAAFFSSKISIYKHITEGVGRHHSAPYPPHSGHAIEDEMEGHKNQVTMLVAEINRVKEENHKLNSMVKRMTSKYNYLQKHIRSLVQQQKRVDGSQILNPDHRSKDVLCPGSINVDSGRAVSNQSDQSSGSNERDEENEKKNVKSMDNHHLPSKKRKINYMQSVQIENGINSSMDDSPCRHGESPDKNPQVLSRVSGEQTVAAPKRIVAVRTRSEESAVITE